MLPSSFRLDLRKDSEEFFAKARGLRAKHLTLLTVPSEKSGLHLALSVKKSLGTAVARNTARRRVRQAIQEILQEDASWKKLPHSGMIVIYPSLQNYETYKQELRSLFEKLTHRLD